MPATSKTHHGLKPLVRAAASSVGARLVRLGERPGLGAAELLRELSAAQQELQVACDLIRPQSSDGTGIIDGEQADPWWQHKLIATVPAAVVETDPEEDIGGINESLIAHTFGALSMLPLKSVSVQDLLTDVARLTGDVCAAESSVVVTIGAPEAPEHLAWSTDFAQRVDAAQMAAGDGPCQRSWDSGQVIHSHNALADFRWPRFAIAAAGTGIASVLAAPLRVGKETLGVLGVYSRKESAFGDKDIKVIELFADAVGAVIHHVIEEHQLRELTTQLEEAMRSRALIEQATGILMAHHRCSAEEAFARLARISQNRNIRIRALAETLITNFAGHDV